MKICKNCKGSSIKNRKNYTHGKNSKPTISLVCKKCGSTNIEVSNPKFQRNKR